MTSNTLDLVAGMRTDSLIVTAGRNPPAYHGFVNPPVYRGSTVLAPTVADLLGYTQPYVYGRRGTPTLTALQEAMCALDHSAGVVFCPSGLSAITTALNCCLEVGDHLLMSDSVYRPARHLGEGVLPRAGVATTFFDPLISPDEFRKLIQPETKAVYLEAPGSLSMDMPDIPALVCIAREYDLCVLMDNTWATPLFFDAIGQGADLVVQAGTKYISGHSDVMIGMVSASARLWPKLAQYHRDTGLCVSPDDIYMTLRGLRTLGIRLRQHQANALHIARWLSARPEVLQVCYPALSDDRLCRINGGKSVKPRIVGYSGSQQIKLFCRRQSIPLQMLILPFAYHVD